MIKYGCDILPHQKAEDIAKAKSWSNNVVDCDSNKSPDGQHSWITENNSCVCGCKTSTKFCAYCFKPAPLEKRLD